MLSHEPGDSNTTAGVLAVKFQEAAGFAVPACLSGATETHPPVRGTVGVTGIRFACWAAALECLVYNERYKQFNVMYPHNPHSTLCSRTRKGGFPAPGPGTGAVPSPAEARAWFVLCGWWGPAPTGAGSHLRCDICH